MTYLCEKGDIMKLTYSVQGKNVIAVFEGQLDTNASAEVQTTFLELEAIADKHITLDCKKLTYLASSGLRQFLSLRHKSIEKNGSLTIENLCDTVRDVFEVTNFYKIFDIR